MGSFIVGDVCLSVPEGAGIRTHKDGITLDFSNFTGSVAVRKLVVQEFERKEVVGIVRKKSVVVTNEITTTGLTAATTTATTATVSDKTSAEDTKSASEAKVAAKDVADDKENVPPPAAPAPTAAAPDSRVAVVPPPPVASAKAKTPSKRKAAASSKPKKQLRMSDMFFNNEVKQQVPRAEHAYKKTSAAIQWKAVGVMAAKPLSEAAEEEEGATVPSPGSRYGASAVVDPKTKKVYVTGGSTGSLNDEEEYLNELWVLNCSGADPSGWQWSRGGSNGFTRRAWHTSSLVQDKLLVFGGQTDKPKPSDGKEADTPAEQQQQQQEEEDEDDTVLMNELTMYDFESGVWFPVYTTGEAPCPRSGHSATAVGENQLVVFGGMNEEGKFLNDVHVLDTTLFSWQRVKTKGSPMKARGYHTAVRVGAKIVFFGGVGGKCNWALKEIYSLDTSTWKWTEHSRMVQGEPPSKRVGQVATLLADGHSIILHGGHDPDDSSRCFDDSFILDTSTWRWNAVDHGHVRPEARAGHCGVTIDSRFATFFGQLESGKTARDFFVLENPTC